MSRTARPITPAMNDVLLTALTSQEHRAYGHANTLGAMVRRGLLTYRTEVRGGREVRFPVLTEAGRTEAVRLGRAVPGETPARKRLISYAGSEVSRLLDIGAGEPPACTVRTRGEAVALPGVTVVRRLAVWILQGALCTRAGRSVHVACLDGTVHMITPDAAPAAAPLPGVVARLGEARPAFADDPANPAGNKVNTVVLTMRDPEGREVPMSNEPCVTRSTARAMLEAWKAEGSTVDYSPDGRTVTVVRPEGEVMTLTERESVPAAAPVKAFGEESGEAWPTTSAAVRALMSGLKVGDSVRVRESGRESVMTVQRGIHHQDGMGAPDSYGVTVGYGPGRYNRFLGIDTVVHGFAGIALAL